MEYTYYLILVLILLNLILWIFMEKTRKESQKTLKSIEKQCVSFGDRLNKAEKEMENLKNGITEISEKLGEIPVEKHFKLLRSELLDKSDSLPAKLKGFVEGLVRKSPKAEMPPSRGIEDRFRQRLDALEGEIETLKRVPAPVEEIPESVSAIVDDPSGLEMVDEPGDSGEIILLEEEQQPAEPLPHQVLIDFLKGYDALPDVKDMGRELESIKSVNITHSTRRNLLDIYQRYYRSESHDLATALERILASDYDMEFNKAQKGLHESSAVGFERVKRGQIFSSLADFERRKIANQSFEQGRGDIILFELCPQVSYKSELILTGKVIIS